MTEYIISCSGCGRRYKGAHSNKKFKCSSCNNVFTFPNGPRAAGIGNVVCAHCWNECPGHAHPFPCPSCNQTISPQYSARSVAWAAGSSLSPSVADLPLESLARPDSSEKMKELEAKLIKIQSRVDELQFERDRAIAQINQKQMEVVQLRTEFQQYRSIAVQALEPICDEFSQRSKMMFERLDLMAVQAQALREEFVVRIEKLETDIDQSRNLLQALASEINTRLASAIGAPAPTAVPSAKRTGTNPPPAPDPRPVLPPGELTMTQAMNDILAANGYAKVVKLTPNKK